LGIRVGGGSGAVRRVAGGLAMRSGRSDWDVDDAIYFVSGWRGFKRREREHIIVPGHAE
jgi:hypothetical protein